MLHEQATRELIQINFDDLCKWLVWYRLGMVIEARQPAARSTAESDTRQRNDDE
jgi:hypothetical protein